METDISILSADTRLDEFLLRPENREALRHVVVTREGRISGVLRINTRIRQPLARAGSAVTFGEVAQKNFTIVRETEAMFDVITRLSRHDTSMALVVSAQAGKAPPRPGHIRGVITKEHVADSVSRTVQIYPG